MHGFHEGREVVQDFSLRVLMKLMEKLTNGLFHWQFLPAIRYCSILFDGFCIVTNVSTSHDNKTVVSCKNVAIIWLKCGWLQSDISVEMWMTANRYFRRIWDTHSMANICKMDTGCGDTDCKLNISRWGIIWLITALPTYCVQSPY